MKKLITATREEIPSLLEGKKSAIMAFGTPLFVPGVMLKTFSATDGKKGFEQLKRWCSTASFEVVVLSAFDEAFKNLDRAHASEWLKDHAAEPDFPLIVVEGEVTDPDLKTLLSL
jgi:hypothetical protein